MSITKKLGGIAFRVLSRIESVFDKQFFSGEIPRSELISHKNWRQHLVRLCNKENMRVLEIGSREVTGPSSAREDFNKATYVGFDYYPGKNVDVVGDVHKLSSYFAEDEKFDLIFSSACFEHFAMPWLVSIEIAKLLKTGGYVFVETHFSYSLHERPWHFFQYSDMALRVLFPAALGFECIEAGLSNPMIGRFSAFADEGLRYGPITNLFCHSEFLGRKIGDIKNFDWHHVKMDEVVGNTKYPSPKVV